VTELTKSKFERKDDGESRTAELHRTRLSGGISILFGSEMRDDRKEMRRGEGRTRKKARACTRCNEIRESVGDQGKEKATKVHRSGKTTCRERERGIKRRGDAGIKDEVAARCLPLRGETSRRKREEKCTWKRTRLQGARSLLPTPWPIYPRPL